MNNFRKNAWACSFFLLIAVMLSESQLHANIINVKNSDHFSSITKENSVLVKFSADWCSVCEMIETPYEELSNEAEFQHVTFAHVDVEKNQDLSKQYGIVGIPTFVYMSQGTKNNQAIGVENIGAFKEDVRLALRKHFSALNSNCAACSTHIKTEQDSNDQQPEPVGIIGKIKAFILMIFSKIKNLIMDLIDTIKGIFGW